MGSRQQIGMLSGDRLHLQDGPIDLVIHADGRRGDVKRAYRAATDRFVSVLDELCAELSLLRAPAIAGVSRLRGKVARRMERAVAPYAGETFITPMAAVAGAVAEEILEEMTAAAFLRRAYVNNGGDIALHLAPGETYAIGLIADRGEYHDAVVIPCAVQREAVLCRHGNLSNAATAKDPVSAQRHFVPQRARDADLKGKPSMFGKTVLGAEDGIFGVATSGWGGRSFSLGIADAVTVLAKSAAEADAAATIIANAVDLPGHPAVTRRPACDLKPDSDLGGKLVTCGVAGLAAAEIEIALGRGARLTEKLIGRGIIRAAALRLQGVTKIAGGRVLLTENSNAAFREPALT